MRTPATTRQTQCRTASASTLLHQRVFFLVWSPTGIRPPTARHATHEIAQAEARRLALVHKSQEFYVLRATDSYVVDAVRHTELFDESEIPF